jgi:hypothetical protein
VAFFLAYAGTSLLIWAFKPSALLHLGGSLSALPTNMTPAATGNYSLVVGLLITASPFVILQLVLLLYRHRKEFVDVAPDIRLHRRAIAADLVKVSVSFLFAAAAGAFGLHSLTQKPLMLAEDLLYFLTASAVCYMLIASALEMIKYLPIVQYVLIR